MSAIGTKPTIRPHPHLSTHAVGLKVRRPHLFILAVRPSWSVRRAAYTKIIRVRAAANIATKVPTIVHTRISPFS
jgi:hypothetical protein